MKQNDISVFVMGCFDGLTCGAGTIAVSYLAGNTHLLVLVAVGLAIAEAVAMAGGQYLSEQASGISTLRHAGIIGIAAMTGTLVPALPFLFASKHIALIGTLVLLVAMAVLIAQVRVKSHGFRQAYGQTFAILLCAGGLSVGVTLLLGGVAK